MNDSRKPSLPSRPSGGLGKSGPVSGTSAPQVHGGLLETLLVAAVSGDELVTKLLQASLRGDQSMTVKLAKAVAEHRGVLQEQAATASSARHAARTVRYEDKLLAAIHREEILLDSVAAASVRGERSKLFRLCRELTLNRKRFDPEFRGKTNITKEPDL